MRDFRLPLRFLAKRPGWTVAAVLTVAIGIAGSTLAFSFVDRALWQPLGFADGGELVTLYTRSGGEYSTIAWRNYAALRGDAARRRRRPRGSGGPSKSLSH